MPHDHQWRSKPYIRDRARQLRHDPTPAEALLWQQLRNRNTAGLKWRRQHPLGPFIADFYCAAQRLVVELDGPIHDRQVDRDAERDAWLTQRGYRVLRVRNHHVERDIAVALAMIDAACAGA